MSSPPLEVVKVDDIARDVIEAIPALSGNLIEKTSKITINKKFFLHSFDQNLLLNALCHFTLLGIQFTLKEGPECGKHFKNRATLKLLFASAFASVKWVGNNSACPAGQQTDPPSSLAHGGPQENWLP